MVAQTRLSDGLRPQQPNSIHINNRIRLQKDVVDAERHCLSSVIRRS
jgi:hypothetical protein